MQGRDLRKLMMRMVKIEHSKLAVEACAEQVLRQVAVHVEVGWLEHLGKKIGFELRLWEQTRKSTGLRWRE